MSNESGASLPLTGGRSDTDDSLLLLDIARAVLARVGDEGWSINPDEFWCRLTPPGTQHRTQGWKLHVSTALLAAPVVLARAADVLIRANCSFKFAKTFQNLTYLLSGNAPRGSGGKFITAYPANDELFRTLALELDRVTDGLPGPVILSDRPFRPGGLVYYRYGAIGGQTELSNDGTFESVLVGPEGQRVTDQRQAWFSPPPWAALPIAAPPAGVDVGAGATATATTAPTKVLLGDRFVVGGAIKHSYGGGVFRAVDQQTNADVILKQARPHVAGDFAGADARDVLRHEAQILDLLSPLGLAPAKVALFSHQGYSFLAQEQIPGSNLRAWAQQRTVTAWRGQGSPLTDAVAMARQMVEIVASVHEQGLVLCDFNPNNLIVTPENQLRLIDLEFAVAADVRITTRFTQAYAGPEVTSGPRYGPAPAPDADLFSLGATILFAASGVDPLMPVDDALADRLGQDRLAGLVTRLGQDMPAVQRLSALVVGLMRDDPQHRWSLSRAREFLADVDVAAESANGSDADSLPPAVADRLVSDGMTYALRTMTEQKQWLFTANEFGRTTDPCNVQHGAAGVLGVLTRAAATLGDERLLAGVSTVAGWVAKRLFDVPRILPGLYFGRSGTAWALYDAARLLDDDKMAEQAVTLAKQVPVQWPNPDICHGAAGAGMTQLHLWNTTGDPELLSRGVQAADCVLKAVRERDGLHLWPIPGDFDSNLAGLEHYGFAHGVAGAGAFLLYAGIASGRAEYLDAARRAGETLLAVADIEDGAAWWPSGEATAPDKARMRHWCSGSSGVGTFLIRLWLSTGEPRYRELAEAGAAAIRRDKWYSGPSACHGLAGDGEFLLDLASLTGEQRYRDWAGELAELIHVRHAMRDGLMVLPDEGSYEVHAGFNTGFGGPVGFLLRLRHGGPRWWMPDALLPTKSQDLSSGLTDTGRS